MRKLSTVITLMTFVLSPLTASCLERLSASQMKQATAQSGVTIAFGNVVTAGFNDEIAIINPDDEAQFISFINISTFTTLNTGRKDMNGDGYIHHLKLDVSSSGAQPMVSIKCPDLDLQTNFSAEQINFCGNNIGSLKADKMAFSSFHMYLGPHGGTGGTGIDMEFGSQVSIDSITYQDTQSNSLVFSNILLARSIEESISEPGTWEPAGAFTFGNIANGFPVTLDVAQDNQATWNMTDSEGTPYTVDNPRNGSGFIALNLPMKGSVRVDRMEFGGTNLGSFAMDNLDVQKLYIEIPGRGLGAP